ncbi:MAG TPA: AGE family epimerase/isomerase [Terriglobales bacterium]|nr:AGE family epimerase/isomerase [Terriglobales bacterium]
MTAHIQSRWERHSQQSLDWQSGSNFRGWADSKIEELEHVLKENILGFWLPRCLDFEHGGYAINFDRYGHPNGRRSKGIVTQARMLWLFSASFVNQHGGPELLHAADSGYQFLREHMWDREHGGFFWEVGASGNSVLGDGKHLYGQAFGLFALSAYGLATRNTDALAFACDLFDLLERRAHDSRYGGYREFFRRDWGAAPATEIGYLGMPAGLKLMNTHLHLLEAYTLFFLATAVPMARQRILELISILSQSVVREEIGTCTDVHLSDWQPLLTGDSARTSYGHVLENISLLINSSEAIEASTSRILPLCNTLFNYCLKYGYDKRNGGFYESGPLGRPADNRRKTWWVQAEALWSTLQMHHLTWDPTYLEIFNHNWEFVKRHQIDWTYGEWYEQVNRWRVVKSDKGHIWKAGYHQGRAMIECIRLLRECAAGSNLETRLSV